MSIKKVVFFLLVTGMAVALLSSKTSKESFPKKYFRSPVDGPIQLSGSFGELRSNHFHSGIDIKPQKRGRSGQNIYAAAEGYVSRILVSHRGYGYGMYVKHPNGYTTVYGHLLKFNDKIAKHIEQLQYDNETFHIDSDTFPPNLFPVRKGEIIGYLGNSGSSGGAHLHFEIRETESGHAFNPLLFGLTVNDNIPPKLQELKIYNLNHKLETITTKKYSIKANKKNKGYYLPSKEITVKSGRVGIALKTFDFMTGVSNWNGPYNIKMYQDDSLIYHFEVNELAFEEWYYLNAHVDYQEFKQKKSYFNRCFLLPGNGNTTIYKEAINQGIIELREGETANIKLVAQDITGNKSSIGFKMVRKGTDVPKDFATFNYILPYKERNAIRQNSIEMYFDEGSFYEDVYLQYSYSIDKSNHYFAGVHHIHDKYVPLHTPFSLKIKPSKPIADSLKSKLTIVRCDGTRGEAGFSSKWEGDFLVTKTRSFGSYSVMLDTIPPVITSKSFSKNMANQTKMTFKIKDNLSGVKSFNAYVDGKWILLNHDGKSRQLSHTFDEKISRGKHQLKIELKDNQDNITVFEEEFVR